MLAEVLEEDVATNRVSSRVDGGVRAKLMDMKNGLMNVSGPTSAVSAWGGELETYESAIDEHDTLEASSVGGNHGVADVGALGAAGKSRGDEQNWTVRFQIRDVPIERDITSIRRFETLSNRTSRFRG